MNIPAKIWTWIVIVWGVYAMFAGLFGEELDGYMMLGGLIFLATALVALTYIWKDDAQQKKTKQLEDDERIARILEERMKK
jgi:uncharacterized membrane protein